MRAMLKRLEAARAAAPRMTDAETDAVIALAARQRAAEKAGDIATARLLGEQMRNRLVPQPLHPSLRHLTDEQITAEIDSLLEQIEHSNYA